METNWIFVVLAIASVLSISALLITYFISEYRRKKQVLAEDRLPIAYTFESGDQWHLAFTLSNNELRAWMLNRTMTPTEVVVAVIYKSDGYKEFKVELPSFRYSQTKRIFTGRLDDLQLLEVIMA